MPTFAYSVSDFVAYTKIRSADVNSKFTSVRTFFNTTKLDDDNIQNAGITRATKLKLGTANYVLINDGTGAMSEEATLAKTRGGAGASMASVTFPSTGVLVTEAGSQTLQAKTIDSTNCKIRNPSQDTDLTFDMTSGGPADVVLKWYPSGNQTITLPDATGQVVLRDTTDTLTNKTLTSPTINTPTVTGSGGTLTLPAGPDTLVGRATTDTLTNKTISGASNTISNINLTSQITGTLPVANGGTGAATLAANNVLLGNGTSALQVVAPGTSGNVLTSNGTTWQSTALGAIALIGCRAYRGSSQSIPHATFEVLIPNTESYDVGNMYNTGTGLATIPSDGYYTIRAVVSWAINANGIRSLIIEKDSTTTIATGSTSVVSANSVHTSHIATTQYFTTGTTIRLVVYQDSGGALNASSGTGATYFEIHKVGL